MYLYTQGIIYTGTPSPLRNGVLLTVVFCIYNFHYYPGRGFSQRPAKRSTKSSVCV